jgi:hypothetical protein
VKFRFPVGSKRAYHTAAGILSSNDPLEFVLPKIQAALDNLIDMLSGSTHCGVRDSETEEESSTLLMVRTAYFDGFLLGDLSVNRMEGRGRSGVSW